MANHYEVPKWAGKPPVGLHLDVLKEDKLVQKLMLDEKKCYLFGRNKDLCDICIDHQSCSRVHAAFVYHTALERAFLVDLGSTHGTYIGKIRLEGQKPTQLPIDSRFHFGASTRNYILRARPQASTKHIMEELEAASEDNEGALLGLPESEMELDNLTEFNTAHNRRISMLGIDDKKTLPPPGKRRRITFAEEDEIINPEDVDPSVGRFRNLVSSTVVPVKKPRLSVDLGTDRAKFSSGEVHPNLLSRRGGVKGGGGLYDSLYTDMPGPDSSLSSSPSSLLLSSSMASKLGLSLPNPAPDVELEDPTMPPPSVPASKASEPTDTTSGSDQEKYQEPAKKKYAKEAWPGKKPVPSLLV
uniref:Nuclear inhibitor of protein phosphatase 1 n=1 Tax=Cacopsylla melanoneura TaxID=428564 RepID=A0A8D8PRW9_9HEMI